MNTKQTGFTLVEAMITVAIIGIIATIAWPMFEAQSTKNRRTDGIAGLLSANNEMEKCYSDQSSYTGCSANGTSPKGFYTITTNVTDSETYTLTAAPKAEFPDPSCGNLTINNLGVKGHNTTDGTPLKRCWAQ